MSCSTHRPSSAPTSQWCPAPASRPVAFPPSGSSVLRMKAMVTGGAGFIGSTLVDRLLAEGWRVDAVDDLSTGSLGNLATARAQPDRSFSFHRIDVSSPAVVDLIAHRRPEVVFHLAAQADV